MDDRTRTILRILQVEDNPTDAELVLTLMRRAGLAVESVRVDRREDFIAQLRQGGFDLILCDYSMPGFDGPSALKLARETAPSLPFIFVSGTIGEEIAIESLKNGATDYVLKQRLERIVPVVRRALREAQERRERERITEERDRLFNYSLDLLCIAGFDGYFKQLNPAWEKTLGWTIDELLAKPHLEFVHSDDREATIQVATTIDNGELVYFFENRYLCRDGSYKWLSWNARPLSKERQFFAVARDITERKRAEEALHTAEAKYRTLVEQIPATTYIAAVDEAKTRLYVSPQVKTMLGVSPEDSLNNPDLWRGMVHLDDRDRVSAEAEHFYQSGEPFALEYRLLAPDGRVVWVHDQAVTVHDEEGRPPHIQGVLIDITERKQAEERLKIQLERLASLRAIDTAISSSTDLTVTFYIVLTQVIARLKVDAAHIYVFNPETNELEIRAAQGFRSSGSQKERIRMGEGIAGRCALERVVLDGHSLTREDVASIAPHLVEEDFTCYVVLPLISKGKIMGVLTVFEREHRAHNHDWVDFLNALAGQVTIALDNFQLFDDLQRSKAELENRVAARTSELMRALRVKDEFLANMSHELRTPLNAIIGLSETLADQIAGPLNEKQLQYLNTIRESGYHLLSLISDILDLAKIESGQLTLERGAVDIHSIAQSSLRMVQQLAQKNSQELVLDIDEQLDVMTADERRLRQMLVNLLSNAVKFTPERGRIGLEIRGNRDENVITFTVWDTGIGINEADLPRLFHPFVQLDSDLARKTTGTGLGLALVAQMARLHGGSVSVESQPAQGSRFTITLPWESALITNTSERSKTTDKFRVVKPDDADRQRTILLVEDTDEVIMVIRDYLEYAGYKVEVARNGLEGIVQAKRIHSDLILMDIQMPDMDGLEATRQLRSDADFPNIPIIALTALAMKGDRERCLAAGMDEYVSKPVHLKSLVKMIGGFLSGA